MVDLGNSIKPKHVTSQPVFAIYATDTAPTPTRKDNATYVLALTDPDATSHSNPVKAQMCHWIATNITIPDGSSAPLDLGHVSGGFLSSRHGDSSGDNGIQELMPYFPPTPPPKTGYHRYVFVVLASEPKEDITQPAKPKDRPHWGYGKIGSGVREWAKDNSLKIVGESIETTASEVVICLQCIWMNPVQQLILQGPTSSTPRTKNSNRYDFSVVEDACRMMPPYLRARRDGVYSRYRC